MQSFQFSGDPVPPLRAVTVDGRTVPPTREEIRAFAVAKMEEIGRNAVERGANYQQALLDLQDQANTFGRTLPPEDQAAFFSTLQEELEVAASALNQRSAKHEAVAIGKATGTYHVVLIVGAIITFFVVSLVFRVLF